MKKLRFSLITALSFGVSAGAIAATPDFYVGGQLGYQNVEVEESSTNFWNESRSTDFSGSGVAGGVFVGAKFNVTPDIYLAPEVNFGYGNGDGGDRFSYEDYSRAFEVEADRSYGISALAGYNVTDKTSVYGRLGYQWTKFEASFSETGWDTESDSETFGGVRFGLGMETAVAQNVALRLDWSYTDYSSETYDNEFFGSTEYDPTESLFQVGLLYTF